MDSLPVYFFAIFQIMVPVFLVLLIGVIIFLNIKEIYDYHHSNKKPVLTVPAKVINKRAQVIHHLHQIEIHLYYPTSTYYFVTFELETGENIEFEISGLEYSSFFEEDYGNLTYQGIDLLHFAKKVST